MSKKSTIKVAVAGDKSCPACQSAVSYLDSKGVSYKFYDANSGKGAKIAGAADAIPVIQVCNTKKKVCEISEGFSKTWLDSRLF